MIAETTSKPVAEPCAEKQEFQEDILTATIVIVDLTNREADASKARDFAMLKTVRTELRVARQWKDHMVAGYVRHVWAHRC